MKIERNLITILNQIYLSNHTKTHLKWITFRNNVADAPGATRILNRYSYLNNIAKDN